jgi:hypothetical protein
MSASSLPPSSSSCDDHEKVPAFSSSHHGPAQDNPSGAPACGTTLSCDTSLLSVTNHPENGRVSSPDVQERDVVTPRVFSRGSHGNCDPHSSEQPASSIHVAIVSTNTAGGTVDDEGAGFAGRDPAAEGQACPVDAPLVAETQPVGNQVATAEHVPHPDQAAGEPAAPALAVGVMHSPPGPGPDVDLVRVRTYLRTHIVNTVFPRVRIGLGVNPDVNSDWFARVVRHHLSLVLLENGANDVEMADEVLAVLRLHYRRLCMFTPQA